MKREALALMVALAGCEATAVEDEFGDEDPIDTPVSEVETAATCGTVWTTSLANELGGGIAARGVATGPGDALYVIGAELTAGGENDIFLRRYTADGVEQWAAHHGGDAAVRDYGQAVAMAPDGSVLLVGQEARINPVTTRTDRDIWLAKYTDAGAPMWTRTHTGDDLGESDTGYAIAAGADGSVFAAGDETVAARVYKDAWLRKHDTDGTELWTARHTSAGDAHDSIQGLAVDSTGAVIASGHEGYDGTVGTAWIRKYDTDGTELWTRTHDGMGGGIDTAPAVAVGADDSIVVVGTESKHDTTTNIWVRKYDADGTELWTERAYGSDGLNEGRAVAVDSAGTIIAVGTVESYGSREIWVRAYDANGATLCSATHDEADLRDEGNGVTVLSDGSFVVAGMVTTPDGPRLWLRRFTL